MRSIQRCCGIKYNRNLRIPQSSFWFILYLIHPQTGWGYCKYACECILSISFFFSPKTRLPSKWVIFRKTFGTDMGARSSTDDFYHMSHCHVSGPWHVFIVMFPADNFAWCLLGDKDHCNLTFSYVNTLFWGILLLISSFLSHNQNHQTENWPSTWSTSSDTIPSPSFLSKISSRASGVDICWPLLLMLWRHDRVVKIYQRYLQSVILVKIPTNPYR